MPRGLEEDIFSGVRGSREWNATTDGLESESKMLKERAQTLAATELKTNSGPRVWTSQTCNYKNTE